MNKVWAIYSNYGEGRATEAFSTEEKAKKYLEAFVRYCNAKDYKETDQKEIDSIWSDGSSEDFVIGWRDLDPEFVAEPIPPKNENAPRLSVVDALMRNPPSYLAFALSGEKLPGFDEQHEPKVGGTVRISLPDKALYVSPGPDCSALLKNCNPAKNEPKEAINDSDG